MAVVVVPAVVVGREGAAGKRAWARATGRGPVSTKRGSAADATQRTPRGRCKPSDWGQPRGPPGRAPCASTHAGTVPCVPPPPPTEPNDATHKPNGAPPPLPATLAAPRPTHLGVWGTHERRRGRGGAPVANHRRRRRRLPPRERIAEKGGAPGGLPRRRNPGERWGNNGGRGGAAHCPVPARELPPEGAALRLSGRPTRTA